MPRVFVSWIVSLLVAATLSAQQAPASPPTCDAEQHRQFDFWVGEWDVTAPNGNPAGSNKIEKILNDCVLLENWTGNGGSIGKSFNMYYRARDEWRQTWVDGAGSRLDLVGGLDGDRMVMRGETPARDGGTVLHEVSWTPLEDGTVRQHWRSSRDGGETWVDSFLGIYRKR